MSAGKWITTLRDCRRCFLLLLIVLLLFGCGSNDRHNDDSNGILKAALLQTTDMHDRASGVGEFNAYTPMNTADNDPVLGGFARLAAKIVEIRDALAAQKTAVLLVDSGDYTMGTVYDFLWENYPAPLQFIQSMGYDAITIGNHEFDYGPAKLGIMFDSAISGGFSVPIVASNTQFDGVSGTGDDELENLKAQGYIVDSYVKVCDNGLKVGFLGLMGTSADSYAPNAVPVTFQSDYTDPSVQAFIQAAVDDLHTRADVVVALSHSGIINPNSDSPSGDDMTLAESITGIDIILSGHDHETTESIIDVANGAHTTHIICAGSYTENLAQLNFKFDTTTKLISDLELINHAIDDTILGNSYVNTLVTSMNSDIDTLLGSSGVIDSIADIIAVSHTNLPAPQSASSTGIGNLISDAVRFAGTDTASSELTLGAFANGTIRGSFTNGQEISFADMIAVVPLGMTLATDQDPTLIGYPLLKVYLTGAEIVDTCRFIARTVQFDLPTYYCSLSGVQFAWDSGYTVNSDDVMLYQWNDYACSGTTTPIDLTATYPLITDTYVMALLLSDTIQGYFDLLGLNIVPKFEDGSVLSADNMLDARIDKNNVTSGVQEVQVWSALQTYVQSAGALDGAIPDSLYGEDSLTRVNP